MSDKSIGAAGAIGTPQRLRVRAEASRLYSTAEERAAFRRGAADEEADVDEPQLHRGVIRDAYLAGRRWRRLAQAGQPAIAQAIEVCLDAVSSTLAQAGRTTGGIQ